MTWSPPSKNQKKKKNADCLSFQLGLFIINSLEECMGVILGFIKIRCSLCMCVRVCVWVCMLHPDMIHIIQIVWLHTKRDYFLVVWEEAVNRLIPINAYSTL